MRQYNVYLHKYVRDILSQFGDVNAVVNHIVDEAMAGRINLYGLDKAPARSSGDMCQYTFTIANEQYNELVDAHGPRSSLVSLRRIIYTFVDNEMYVDLGWKTIHQPNVDAYTASLTRLADTVRKLGEYVPSQHRPLYNALVDATRRLIDAQHS